jgi:hypothetical protein
LACREAAVRAVGFAGFAVCLAAAFGASTETAGSEFSLLWAKAASNGASSAISIAIALTLQRARNFNIECIPDAGSTAGFSDAHRRRRRTAQLFG